MTDTPHWESDQVRRDMQAAFERGFMDESQVAAPLTVPDYEERMALLTPEQILERLEKLSRWQQLPYDDRQMILATITMLRAETAKVSELAGELQRTIETMRGVRAQLRELTEQVQARGTESVPGRHAAQDPAHREADRQDEARTARDEDAQPPAFN